jgi:microcystin-dependent protein
MEGIIGYTTLFAGNFAPKNWGFCNGQVISIASNTALFSILGTTYGGNGTTTFALPNVQGRTVVGTGNGPGLSPYTLGQVGGGENQTLTMQNMANHVHNVSAQLNIPCTEALSGQANPTSAMYAQDSSGNTIYGLDAMVNMAPINAAISVAPTGASGPFEILRPYLALNYVICMYGIFPARN